MAETPPQSQPDETMVDLLVKQVTEGLSSAEQRELDVMDSGAASAYLRDLERAAAAVTLAAGTGGESLPPQLARRIAEKADAHFAVSSLDAARAAKPSAAALPPARVRASPSSGYGWLAAAACLVLALFGWLRSPAPPPTPVVAVVPPASIITPPLPAVAPAPATPSQEREALMAKSDSIKAAMGTTKDPAAKGVTGDVVWDPVTQKGFMHFVGLMSNDPAVKQYQVWVFDAARDKRYPIDGGVFDVPADANEVVIPFNISMPVSKAAAFAVTVEKPGGVVVSDRQHVVALGAAG